MSILIKMEMPKRCADCPFIGWAIRVQKEISQLEDYASCKVARREISEDVDTERPSWCPLIELPPHGRLIDADALKEDEIMRWWDGDDHRIYFAGDVDDAPTIIEAEE